MGEDDRMAARRRPPSSVPLDIERYGRSFGAVAAHYDRHRPSYPEALVADVCAWLSGPRVVEVGAGTGIATRQFVAHGLDITVIEPDAAMAAVLVARLGERGGGGRVTVEVAAFEAWSAGRGPDAELFDGLICAQAWHWTRPETRWRDAAAALRSGGEIALFWHDSGRGDPALHEAIDAIYAQRGLRNVAFTADTQRPNPTGSASPYQAEEWPGDELASAPEFTDLEVRNYEWTARYSPAEYVAHLDTVSVHAVLPEAERAALGHELVDAIGSHVGDELTILTTTGLYRARRV
jgi:SAM-dependent methyltransferase